LKIGVIVAAAGSGRRMGAQDNKVLLPLAGKPVLAHSLACFGSLEEVSEVVVVTKEEDRPRIETLMQEILKDKEARVVLGGAERQDSVYLGLMALAPDTKWVIIHDGARPFIKPDLVRRGIEAVKKHLAVGVAVKVTDTIKRVQKGLVLETPERSELWAMQTPQIFDYKLVVQAYEDARAKGITATDDCGVVEAFGHPVHIVEGDYANSKITTPEDLPGRNKVAVGFGYDVHRLVVDRPLILGGVEIPHDHGLLGHSDADVVTHAVMDALLGAMGRGDIGEHFPDTDARYKDISSIALLEEVLVILAQERFVINNLDITIMAQKPKLGRWKGEIKTKLAQVLAITEAQINVKATTAEGLGFVGREEGIAAQAVVSLAQFS